MKIIKMMKRMISYFSKTEATVWGVSVICILIGYFLFDGNDALSLVASLIGVTSLIFCAKGNPVGQALMIIFSIIYGIISYRVAYYGEMITYLGMTAPMALFSLISWLKNPYKGKKSEVKVGRISLNESFFMLAITTAVSVFFYFILKILGNANLSLATVSVFTSFLAAYLTFRRCELFALAYALNDIVLIILWGMVQANGGDALSVIICFCVFLLNDLYGYLRWLKMKKSQAL